MQRIFRQIIFSLALLLSSISLNASHTKKNLQLIFPTAFLFSENEAHAVHMDVGFGLKASYLMFSEGKWRFGPGVALQSIIPTENGNATVSIRPYQMILEILWANSIDLFDDKKGFSPHFSIGVQTGALIVSKWVKESQRIDASFIYGAALNSGLIYKFSGVGMGLSYGVSLTNISFRHKVEFLFEYEIPS